MLMARLGARLVGVADVLRPFFAVGGGCTDVMVFRVI
jgi:hypothetical protein